MENVAHWTRQSTADYVYSISSTFIAQIETKMEDDDISRTEVASRLKKSSGRVSQILNNPGNLSIRVMVEVANSLGMKVGVIAYDDSDPDNTKGPIDPDVFVKSWEKLGRPVDLFALEEAVLPVAESPMVTHNFSQENSGIALFQTTQYSSFYSSAPPQILPKPSVPDLYPHAMSWTQPKFYEPKGSPTIQSPIVQERKAAA